MTAYLHRSQWWQKLFPNQRQKVLVRRPQKQKASVINLATMQTPSLHSLLGMSLWISLLTILMTMVSGYNSYC